MNKTQLRRETDGAVFYYVLYSYSQQKFVQLSSSSGESGLVYSESEAESDCEAEESTETETESEKASEDGDEFEAFGLVPEENESSETVAGGSEAENIGESWMSRVAQATKIPNDNTDKAIIHPNFLTFFIYFFLPND